jgi:hypothetical protein
MQQLLLHMLLAVQMAWQALSLLRHVAPLGTPEPDWQQSLGRAQVPPGATHEPPAPWQARHDVPQAAVASASVA